MGKETAVVIEARKIATVFNIVAGKADDLNKQEFSKIYDLIKHEKGRDEAVKALSEAGKAISMDSRRREFNNTLQMAVCYCAMNKAVTYSMVSWENLKRVVRLYKYVQKNYKHDVVEQVIKALDVYSKGIGQDRYNNTLEAKVKGLKELYKVEEKESKPEYETVVTTVDKLTSSEKAQLLEYLMANVEVAA